MSQKFHLTIDDIARELGVSKTTVSRAISGKGRISAETRARVQEYIRRHNYRPNAAAKGLAESRTYNLALVLPRDFMRLELPFVRTAMSAICDEAYLHEYNVMICLSTDHQSASLLRTLDYRKVDGVIFTRTVENDTLLELTANQSIPFATLGSLPGRFRGIATVEADHDQVGGCRALTVAMLRGKRGKTALLGNDLNYVVNQNRLAGFRQGCQDLGLFWEQTPIRMGIHNADSCRQAMDTLYAQGVRRFVCMDEDITLYALEYLERNGDPDPVDPVELATLADSGLLRRQPCPIPALEFDADDLGRTACRELIKAIEGEPYEPTPLLGYRLHLPNL